MSLSNYRLWLKVGKTVAIPRSCDRCGHRYFVNARVLINVEFTSILSDLSSDDEDVLINAILRDTVPELSNPRVGLRKFNEEARRIKDSETWRRNVGVLCPGCGQFSQRAMADHFPHGYADGLARKHAAYRALAVPLVWFFALWLPPVSILAVCLRGGIPVSQSFWFLITAWTILLSLFVVIRHLKRRRGCSRIRAIGAKLSEEELHAFVVEEYLRSYLSLDMNPSPKLLQQFARSPTTSFRLPSPDLVVLAGGENRPPADYFDTGARDTKLRGDLAKLGKKRALCFASELIFGMLGCLLLLISAWGPFAEETGWVRLGVGAALMTVAGCSYAAFLGRDNWAWLMWVLTPFSLLLLTDRHRREARELKGQLTVEGRRAFADTADSPADQKFRVRSGLLAGGMWLCFSVTSLALVFVTVREPSQYLLRDLASAKEVIDGVKALFSAWEPQENRGAKESPEIGSEERDDGRDPQSPSENAVATVPHHDEASTSDTFRLWTDATGEHTTEAAFVEHEGGEITLRKRDGRVIELPVERLSDGDQEWLRKVEAHEGQEIEPGSVVVVLGESVEVKLGNEIIGHLTKGAKVTAVQVRDGWVGVNVETEGETMEGWVPREEVERWRHR